MLFLVPFTASLIFYLLTVCRTLYTGDAGELAFAIHSLGIAHPPGYPLLTLFGKFFITIIPGNTAFVLNLFSALMAACSVGIAAHVVRMLLFPLAERDKHTALIISVFAAVLLGFSKDFWASAVGLEVYSLGMLLILLSLYCLLAAMETGESRMLLGAVYFFALGMTNHLTASAMALPILFAFIKLKTPLRLWIYSLALVVVASSLYLFIPIRSSTYPILDWEHLASLRSFIDHITAQRYQGYLSGFRLGNYLENLWRSIPLLAGQLPLWLGLAGIAGVFITGRVNISVRIITLLIISFNFLTVAIYDIPDIEQYYLPSYFFAATGVAALLIAIFKCLRMRENGWPSLAVLSGLLIAAAAFNFGKNDQSDNNLAYVYGMNILNCVPQNSVLLSVGDNSNSSVQYLHFVEGKRPDLKIYDPVKTFGLLKEKFGIGKDIVMQDGFLLCIRQLRQEPEITYLVKEHMLGRRLALDYSSMTLTPQGMVYRPGIRPLDTRVWERLQIPDANDIGRIDFKGLTMLCNIYLNRGEDRQRAGDSTSAYKDFMFAGELASSSREASIHNSLGIFFRRNGWTGLAEEEYQKALKSDHLTADEKANIFVNLANLRKDKGNLDDALSYYNLALDINKEHVGARYNLALTHAYIGLAEGRLREAVSSFEEAVSYSGADPRLFYNIAALYDMSLNDTANAIQNYKRFTELVQGLPECKSALQRIDELTR